MTNVVDQLELVLQDCFGRNYTNVDPQIENAMDRVHTRVRLAHQLRDAVLEEHRNAPSGHTTSMRFCTDACRIADALL